MPTLATFGLLESSAGWGSRLVGPDHLWTPVDAKTENGCEGCADGAPVWEVDSIEHPNFSTQTLLCGNCASKMLRDVASAIQPVWFTVCEEGFIDQTFPILQAKRD